jgi:putative acetyltransferase
MQKSDHSIKIIRTNSDNPDFIALVGLLDSELEKIDGAEHSFYAQFSTIDKIKNVVLAYLNGIPTGCGAIRKFTSNTMEIKRMYVLPNSRDKGIASKILAELEKWTIELSCSKCVLETGKRQPEAIGLYIKRGYTLIPNYGQYENIENSVCFEKELKPVTI